MLKQRIITALVLAPVILGAVVFLPQRYFELFFGVLAALGLYEWANLAGFASVRSKLLYVFAASAVTMVVLYLPGWWNWALAAGGLFWLCAVVIVIAFGRANRAKALVANRGWTVGTGVLVFTATLVGLATLKSQVSGHWLVIWALSVVWSADIGAYFAGRAFGRHKLAPRVSPGKTWEGACGGVAASVLVGAGFALAMQWPGSVTDWILISGALAIVSIFGDLYESAMKRAHGVKDSGALLPGHGGVLDRIDAILAVVPIFALWFAWAGAERWISSPS
ncbi:MAG: phosphatidate cytidylyltransferase [Gammaproteobacteria bacterium]|nr:phosphatidate cytidylyltransferase [Gammaproteobacteria bacterium]